MGAFEALYDRHHAPLLAFCRHMCGSHQDGEDVLQQTFLRAHRALSDRPAPDAMRPWLFAIARNRCLTLLAARREAATMPEDFEPAVDGLAEDVGRRADLRELLHDLAKLPDDQREALVLFELGGSSQAEIAPDPRVSAREGEGARVPGAHDPDRRARRALHPLRGHPRAARGGARQHAAARRAAPSPPPVRAVRGLPARGRRPARRTRLAASGPPTAGLKAAILGAAGLSGGGASAAAAAGRSRRRRVAGGAGAPRASGGAASAGGGGAASAAAVAAGGGAASAGGLAVTALVAKVAVTAAVAGAGVSGAVAAVDSGTRDAAPQVRAAAPAPARTAEPPRRKAPARAPADPSTGTAGQPVNTPAAAVGSRPFARRRAVRRLRRPPRSPRHVPPRSPRRDPAPRDRSPPSTALAPRREARGKPGARSGSRPAVRRAAKPGGRHAARPCSRVPRPDPARVR